MKNAQQGRVFRAYISCVALVFFFFLLACGGGGGNPPIHNDPPPPPPVFVPFSLEDGKYKMYKVAVDETGVAFGAGYFTTPSWTVFVARFNTDGRNSWMVNMQKGNDTADGGLVAKNGFVYIQHDSINPNGTTDIFVSKLMSDTGTIVWTTAISLGEISTLAVSLAVDDMGNSYATNNQGIIKLDVNGNITLRMKFSGAGYPWAGASAYAFNGLFIAGTVGNYVKRADDRFLMRTDLNLVSSSTVLHGEASSLSVRGLAVSKSDSMVCVADQTSLNVGGAWQYNAYFSGYKFQSVGNTESMNLIWTRSFQGSTIATSTGGSDNSAYVCVVGEGEKFTIHKVRSSDGNDLWSVPISTIGGMAEYNSFRLFVTDWSDKLSVYDATSGAKKF